MEVAKMPDTAPNVSEVSGNPDFLQKAKIC